MYNSWAFRKCILYWDLRETSDCKAAPTNDYHLGYTDTLFDLVAYDSVFSICIVHLMYTTPKSVEAIEIVKSVIVLQHVTLVI